MRRLAVVAQNNLVNIVRLRSLAQDRDEPIRSYLARLKGIAAVCKLTLQCSCNPPTTVSYADNEILHCILKGLADEDIRRQVLGVVEEMDLDATIKFIEAKESGKKAGVFLDNGEAALNKITSYRQSQKDKSAVGKTKPDDVKCCYCGNKGHGKTPNFVTKKEVCPAFDKKCRHCDVIGHSARSKVFKKSSVRVEKVLVQCEKSNNRTGVKSVGATPHAEEKSVSLSPSQPVPHMLEENGHMVVKMPRSHPGLKVQVRVNVEMYKKTGLPLRMGRTSMTKKGKILQIPTIELLCDTGAQVDCISRKKLCALGLKEDQLLSPAVAIGCANESPAEVLGVFFGVVTAMEGMVTVKV